MVIRSIKKILIYGAILFVSPTQSVFFSPRVFTQKLYTVFKAKTPTLSIQPQLLKAKLPFFGGKNFNVQKRNFTSSLKNRHTWHNKQKIWTGYSKYAKYASMLVGSGIGLTMLGINTALAEENSGDTKKSVKFVPVYDPYVSSHEESRQKFYELLKTKRWYKAVTEKYITQLAAEEDELMQEYLKITGLTKEELDFYRVTAYPYYMQTRCEEIARMKANAAPLPKELLKKAQTMLKMFFIDANKISIIRNPQYTVNCAACGISLQFGSSYCCPYDFKEKSNNCGFKFSDEALEATLLHEIQHIMHDDAYEHTTLNWCLHNQHRNYDKKAYAKFLETYSKFKERRADIMTGLTDITYCNRSIKCFEELQINDPGENILNSTHESHPVRMTYMRKLLKEMQDNS